MTTVDIVALKAKTDIVATISRYVSLRRRGVEYVGHCPFHDERTPSFSVSPKHGFYHCFGCGAHGDVVGFLQAHLGLDFRAACTALGAPDALPPPTVRRKVTAEPKSSAWVPLVPVPEDAPPLHCGNDEIRIWNPRRNTFWRCRCDRVDSYRDVAGRTIGYVLRVPLRDGGKITPQVTYCVGPDGRRLWCCVPFPSPRPLQGLSELSARPDVPVLIVEGEKCRHAAAKAFPGYVVVTWPGGAQGLRRVDFSPLQGRDVILWPDADETGRKAMIGFADHTGLWREGVAQYVHAVGVQSIQYVDPGTRNDGWDVADALDANGDGWTPDQVRAWMTARLIDVDVAPARRVAA